MYLWLLTEWQKDLTGKDTQLKLDQDHNQPRKKNNKTRDFQVADIIQHLMHMKFLCISLKLYSKYLHLGGSD